MRTNTREINILRRTTLVCLLFGILSLVASRYANSRSLLLDGLYSLIQSLFILGSGRVVALLFKGESDQFPFGFSAFEPFFLAIRSLVLLGMVLAIGTSAFTSLFEGGYVIDTRVTLPLSLLSLSVCFGIFILLSKAAKRLNSPVLKAESKAWLLDTLLSLISLLAMVAVSMATYFDWITVSQYIDPCLTLIFVLCIIPVLTKDLVQYSKELLGFSASEAVQTALEKIAYRFVRKYNFLKADVFATKKGRSLNVLIYMYLKKERPLLQLDAIRLEMIKTLYNYSSWCDADIIFTLDDRWIVCEAIPSLQEA